MLNYHCLLRLVTLVLLQLLTCRATFNLYISSSRLEDYYRGTEFSSEVQGKFLC